MRINETMKADFCRAMRWRQNPFAGLAWFKRDSGGGWVIVSRHWPHMLCWSWLVRFTPRDAEQRWWGAYRLTHNVGGQCAVRFGIGELSLAWQRYWIARDEGQLLNFIAERATTGGKAA